MKTTGQKLAPFLLPASGKAALRGALTPAVSKEGKDKADHFRDQLRAVAHDVKPASRAGTDDPELATQGQMLLDRTAELTDEIKARSKGRDRQLHETLPQVAATDVAAQPPEWRTPDAVLSAVVAKLDQAQVRAPRDDRATPVVTAHPAKAEQPDILPKIGDLPKAPPAADAPTAQRFAVSVDVAETRVAPVLKVMVRDQETHFEPVVQLTQLQRIVDRMATDLVAAPAPPSSAVAAGPDLPPADKPLRMLTLQLDPPDLGAVTVKMRMAGDAVEIRLTADRQETAEMLRQERGDLTDLMQSAGYSFEIASIDHGSPADSNPNNGQAQGQSDQRPSQQPQGGSQSGGSPERQSGDAQSGARHNRQGHDQIEKPAERQPDQKRVVTGNGGALYL